MRPYNTRHKTLSLHSLGIHVPAARPAHRASISSTTSSSSSSSSSNSASPVSMALSASHRRKRTYSESESDDAPVERLPKRRDSAVKRENTNSPTPSSPTARPSIETDHDDNNNNSNGGDEASQKPIDMDAINDEIVEAVIVQLQKSGNRPHLVKELATILMQQLKIVQQSANPCAIISSRLAAYLKRPGWSASAPCPLAKELESVHPRRTYFFLTGCSRQPLPDPARASAANQGRAFASPSPSSDESNSADESDLERRRELSPSPEVDLSSPEFDDMDDDFGMPSTPIGSFSMRGFYMPPRPVHGGSGRHGRGGSPPLEKDEKEFTQTADGLQKRKLGGGDLAPVISVSSFDVPVGGELDRDESSLFGVMSSGMPPASSFVSSPAIRPSTTASLGLGRKEGDADAGWSKLDGLLEWDRSPETIALEELDCLLDDF
ncbi:hypothetical protein VTJ83DRAFT_5482 [Remersonia thermophila]|uniref:GDS1 winged helix domain-containing protein n=1 Tax=Remersonia thermophila TaxID=72144 RepID=A0ABR4D7Q9_9PEZI